MKSSSLINKTRAIRKEFEEGKINVDELKKLYLEYNKIEDIDSFILKALKLFPCANCGLTSVYIRNKLGGKIINGKYVDQNHTFLLLNDLIIDITADQFGGPKVYVGPLKYPWFIDLCESTK